MKNMKKTFKVDAIKNGTVIDHITEENGLPIIGLLDLETWKHPVTLGISYPSRRMGKKDLIKVENKELTPGEVNKIALIAPKATINIIRNFKIVKKVKVAVADVLEGLINCPNPACISNHEPLVTKFFLEKSGREKKFCCAYCERCFIREEIKII